MGSRLSVGHHSFIRPKYLCFEVSTALSESLLRFWRNSSVCWAASAWMYDMRRFVTTRTFCSSASDSALFELLIKNRSIQAWVAEWTSAHFRTTAVKLIPQSRKSDAARRYARHSITKECKWPSPKSARALIPCLAFREDTFMEGPTMAMARMVDKPENFGLRPGWSGFMVGMMTFVRVHPRDKYDQIMELRRKREGNKPMNMDKLGMEHKNE
jgi:hypothetical protein